MNIILSAYGFILERRLAMPALLFCINIGCSVSCFLSGDTKRAIYWAASAVCIAAVSV